MKGDWRILIYFAAGALFGGTLAIAMAELPDFGGYRGPYGDLVLRTAPALRHAQQGVAAVTFDYRGFDTLGEEYILFAAVAGGLLLARRQEREHEGKPEDRAGLHPPPAPSPPLTACAALVSPFTLLLGIYVVLHGHLTPGGGFQGGVVAASGVLLLYLAGEYREMHRVAADHPVALAEVAGASAFAIIALFPLLQGEPYLCNLLPLGIKGDLVSAGQLPVFNCAVGLEVASAFLLLVSAFLYQLLVIKRKKP